MDNIESGKITAFEEMTEPTDKLTDVQFAILHTLIDELVCLLKDGYVEPKYSNNEEIAPLSSVSLSALHHYWFSPTDKGEAAWQARVKR